MGIAPREPQCWKKEHLLCNLGLILWLATQAWRIRLQSIYQLVLVRRLRALGCDGLGTSVLICCENRLWSEILIDERWTECYYCWLCNDSNK